MEDQEFDEDLRPRKATKLDNIDSSLKLNKKRVSYGVDAENTLGLKK